MKKIITILLIVVLMLSLAVSVSAEETKFNVKVTSSATKVKPGDQFEVSFLVTDITEKSGIVGMDMIVEYDASKVIILNKTNIFPAQWGKYAADFSPDLAVNQTGSWSQILLYDGDAEDSSIAVFNDNELGIKIVFKALENASGSVKIGLSNILAASNDLDTIAGKASSMLITITNDVAPTTTEKVTTTAKATEKITEKTQAPTKNTEAETTAATASSVITESIGSEATSEVSETSGTTESTQETAIVSTTESASSQVITTGTAASSSAEPSDTPSTTAKSENGGGSALTVIVIIAAVVIAAVAFFAIMKFKKSKEDDNPVNPG